jgi:protein-histidine N-methyltransferase
MSFQFAFRGDDIAGSPPRRASISTHSSGAVSLGPEFIPTLYSIEELLPKQPMRISFENVEIPVESGHIKIARRDLYDVKYQLMKQDKLDATEEILLRTNEDVKALTYEGGLKVWECTTDLVRYLHSQVGGYIDRYKTMLELGCGAGWPSAYLLAQILRADNATSGKTTLILADYNKTVLRLGTVINMFLTWRLVVKQIHEEGEVDLTPEVLNEFVEDLKRRSIELKFISGGWSQELVDLVGPKCDLVLASETLYSRESIPAFTDTLLGTLNPLSGHGLVASKMIYFGVGGGIVEFSEALDRLGAHGETVFEDREGVGRAILKVHIQ